MKCPHCKENIEFDRTLWRMWYCADLRRRVILQTSNESLADLIHAPGAGGPASMVIKAIEEFTAAICLAWDRGILEKEENRQKTQPMN